MYTTSVTDLERVANDLNQVAKKYTDGSQQLDQHVSALDGATAQLLAGGSEQWKGVSSDAFHTAYLQRRSRMQQASMLLSQSAQHIAQFAQTIEEHLPAIRADQAVIQGPAHHLLGPDDQSSIMNEMSQAQNAIITALATLNSQLEGLAEEVRDCPEEHQGNDQYNSGNISKSESASGTGSGTPEAGGKTAEERIGDAVGDATVAQEIIDLAKKNGENLDDVAALLEKKVDPKQVQQWLKDGIKLEGASTLLGQGIESDVVTQLINNKANLKDIAANSKILLDGGIKVDLVNGWLKNGTNLNNAIAIMNQGVDLNLLGTSSKVGDFTGLTGATPNEIVSRIPKDAKIETWTPEAGGAKEGMKFRWTDASGNNWRLRMHGPDSGAPAESNATSGWILRVQRKNEYMDPTGNFFKDNWLNPKSSKYNPVAAKNTHMAIQSP